MFSSPARIHYSWVVLAAAVLAVFASIGLARFGYAVVLPDMQAGLNLDNTQAGTLATVSLIGYLVLSVVSGMLASRYGPRIVIAVSLLLAAVGMLVTGLAGGFTAALAGQTITGIGSGGSNVPAMGLMAAWCGARRRGLASGIAVTGSSLAIIVIGSLVPKILTAYQPNGWQAAWFAFGALTLLITVGSFLFLRNDPAEMGLKPLGVDGNRPVAAPQMGAVRLGQVYRSATVWHIGLVYTAFGFSYIIYITFFTKYLIAEGGYLPEAAGRLFMIMGWFSLLCGLVWGTVSDVIGRKYALIIVYLIHATAFSLFALWPAPPGFTISAMLYGLTAWSIPAIMAATCGDVLGSRLAPAAFGFLTIFFGIGQAVGPGVAGIIADAVGSFWPVFLLAGGVAFLGAMGALLLRPIAAEKSR